MNNPEQIGLLAVGIIKLITYLTFLTFYVIRINKLDKLASNSIQKDRSLKFRVAGIGMLIALDAIHIILSYSDPYYYMAPYANFSLIGILAIFDLVLQIYIITRQHKKMTSHKSRSVVMLWIFIACEQVSTIVIVEYYTPNTGIVLPIFKVIVSSVLIILTFLIEPPVQSNLQQLQSNIHEPRLPILSETGSIYEKNTENIYVEFNKEFQVSVQKQYFQFSFKIAVYVCGKFHIITKSEAEFVDLSHELMQIFPNCETVCLKDTTKLKNSLNITKCGEQKQKSYQAFLIQLTKTMQFYCQPLMNFLQITENSRTVLQKKKGSILLKKQSLNSDEQQKQKRPFFTVSYKDEKIYISNYQILQLYLNKSKPQILSFYHKLIAQRRLKIQLLSEQPDQHQILHFIFRVANSKYLWRYFAEWMCLGSVIQDKIFNMFDFWNLGFQALQINVIGYETSFDKSNSVIYLYLISIHNRNVNGETIVVKKRFNDFVKLDRNIRKYIVTENLKHVNLPNLPPKFSPFQSKTSPNSRRAHFDNYIKETIKIQGINHCIKLLEFLQISNEMMTPQSHNMAQIHGQDRSHENKQQTSVYKQKSRSGSGSGPNSLKQVEVKAIRNRGGSQIFESIRVDDLALDR